jgi:antitoxin ParD1/3/4
VSKNTSVALGEPFVEFARRKVESGEFGSTSEVVREAMRRYIAEDEQRARLLALIDEGLASPIDEDFDIDTWFEEEFGERKSR